MDDSYIRFALLLVVLTGCSPYIPDPIMKTFRERSLLSTLLQWAYFYAQIYLAGILSFEEGLVLSLVWVFLCEYFTRMRQNHSGGHSPLLKR